MEKDFFVMRNRLDEAKTVFEGGNVALLNLFTVRIFNFSNNVVTSGRGSRCISASGAMGRRNKSSIYFINGPPGGALPPKYCLVNFPKIPDCHARFYCAVEAENLQPPKHKY